MTRQILMLRRIDTTEQNKDALYLFDNINY